MFVSDPFRISVSIVPFACDTRFVPVSCSYRIRFVCVSNACHACVLLKYCLCLVRFLLMSQSWIIRFVCVSFSFVMIHDSIYVC